MAFLDRLKNLFGPPTQKVSGAQGFSEPPFAANHMTVDKMHGILRTAEAGDTEQLFALYRDIIGGHSHLQAELNTRKLAVLGDPVVFAPRDKTRQEDVLAAKACERLKECPTWTLGRNHLLNGSLYPLAIVEKVFKPAGPNELGLRYDLSELAPVQYHALDYTDRGRLQLWHFDQESGLKLGTRYTPDPTRFIIHRGHLLTMFPDYWGGPLRAAVFWWLFSVMDRDWWVRFLSRFGAPFMVAKYNPANKKDKASLATAFAAATQLFALIISKDTQVEVHEVATSSHGDAFEKMHTIANRELSKLIVGQTMTAEAQAQGLGGNQAQVQNAVRGDITNWDKTSLAATIESELCVQFLRINGLTGSVKMISGGTNLGEVTQQGQLIKTAKESGLELTDAGIQQFSESAGLPFQRAAPAPVPPIPGGGLAALSAMLFADRIGLSATSPSLPKLPKGASLPTNAELDAIAHAGAAGLGAAFAGMYAPIRSAIDESSSAEDLENRLRKWYADLNPDHASELVADALSAYAANGAATARRI